MTAHGNDVAEEARRIAHSGWLARFAGTCARHPWRVIVTWIGSSSSLVGLNAAFHGTLVNDFKIPGHRLPEGDRPDQRQVRRPEGRRAARRAGGARRASGSTRPQRRRRRRRCSPTRPTVQKHDRQQPRRTSRRSANPLAPDSQPALEGRPDRVLRRPVRPDRVRAAAPGHRRRSRTSCARSAPAGIQVAVHRRGREPAAHAGHERHHRPDRRVHHPADPVPRAGADVHPADLRDHRGGRRRSCCCTWRPGSRTSTRSPRSWCR